LWTDEAAEVGRGKEEKVTEEKKSEKRKEEEHQGVRKGRKIVKHGVFPMFCGSGGLKSRLPKAAGGEPSARRCHGAKQISKSKSEKHPTSGTILPVEMLKKPPRFEVKMIKAPHAPGHFWKLRC